MVLQLTVLFYGFGRIESFFVAQNEILLFSQFRVLLGLRSLRGQFVGIGTRTDRSQAMFMRLVNNEVAFIIGYAHLPGSDLLGQLPQLLDFIVLLPDDVVQTLNLMRLLLILFLEVSDDIHVDGRALHYLEGRVVRWRFLILYTYTTVKFWRLNI